MLEKQETDTSFWDNGMRKWVAMADVTNICFMGNQGSMSQNIKLGQNVVGLVKNILIILVSDVLVAVGR